MLTSSVHAHFTCPRILPIVQSPGWRNQTLFPGFKIVPYVVTRSKWLETGLIESLYVVMWIFSSVFFFSLLLSCLLFQELFSCPVNVDLSALNLGVHLNLRQFKRSMTNNSDEPMMNFAKNFLLQHLLHTMELFRHRCTVNDSASNRETVLITLTTFYQIVPLCNE